MSSARLSIASTKRLQDGDAIGQRGRAPAALRFHGPRQCGVDLRGDASSRVATTRPSTGEIVFWMLLIGALCRRR